MAALCATRCGAPDLAIQALFVDSPKNRFHPNGHNFQREQLTAYLPGNGALLDAVAMMARAGTTGAAPGFPADGRWRVRAEGLRGLL